MTEYMKLCARAKKMGYKLTPELRGELMILAGVSDEAIQNVIDKITVDQMAKEFQVPTAVMKRRIGK